MPDIKRISKLQNDKKNLKGHPGEEAKIQLFKELAKGRTSGEEKGWLSLETLEKDLGL